MRSTTILFLFISISVQLIYSQVVKNGGSYLLPQLTQPIPLAEKFDLIIKSDSLKQSMAISFLDRPDKVKLLALWLDGYEEPDKYDLLEMFDRMLMIQNRVESMLKSDVRGSILDLELSRKDMNKLNGRDNKMQYVIDNVKFDITVDRMNICQYFYFDFEWNDLYNSKSASPAVQAFFDYYFPRSVLKILNDQKLTNEQKIEDIDYGSQNMTEYEKNNMVKLYQNYLVENGFQS